MYALLLSGKTLQEIAEQYECDPHEVTDIINRRLKVDANLISSQERTGALQVEMDRLLAIQKAHWTAMEMGDIGSTKIVLEVIKERAKWLQFAAADPEASKTTVLVITGEESDYVQRLKDAAGVVDAPAMMELTAHEEDK